jgi:ATP-binding cassette subfamily B protein
MGERQVIAFARAMASNPGIWILDEATANMDSETEDLIQRALNEVTQQRTSILIAHRLATVRGADRIIVLHKGALLESGNHESLIRADGLYARLYRFQSAEPEILIINDMPVGEYP